MSPYEGLQQLKCHCRMQAFAVSLPVFTSCGTSAEFLVSCSQRQHSQTPVAKGGSCSRPYECCSPNLNPFKTKEVPGLGFPPFCSHCAISKPAVLSRGGPVS